MYGNNYDQVFVKSTEISKFYTIYSKSKAVDILNIFCQEFGVTEKKFYYSYKEQVYMGAIFMEEVYRQGIDYHISEP